MPTSTCFRASRAWLPAGPILGILLAGRLPFGGLVSPADAAEPSDWLFVDVTAAAGIDHVHGYDGEAGMRQKIGGGAAVGDYDGDGWPDIYAIRGSGGPNRLYRNQGDGTFVDTAVPAGLDHPPTGDTGASFVDLDGDGWLDLWVGGIDQAIRLYRNRGDGTFENVSAGSGLPVLAFGLGPAFADIDGDGDLDVFVPQWNTQPAELLWRNDGGFAFSSISSMAFDSATRDVLLHTFTPNFVDLEDDGDLDLLVASDYNHSHVLLNRGDGSFELATDREVIKDENGMGAAVGDFDRDGRLDWFVSSITGDGRIYGNRLYRNLGDGSFEDVTDTAGVSDGAWGWGGCFADFDNDGVLDLFHVNGWSREPFLDDPARLFVGAGDGSFDEEATARGIDDPGQGRGVICFDYDRDGDLDIYIANNYGEPKLFRNDGGNLNHHLQVRLRGDGPGNSEGVGSKIELHPLAGPTLVQVLRAGSNFVSQDPCRAHFGLGMATAAAGVTIRWPDGRTSKVRGVAADQTLEVVAGTLLIDGFETGDLSGWGP